MNEITELTVGFKAIWIAFYGVPTRELKIFTVSLSERYFPLSIPQTNGQTDPAQTNAIKMP